MRIGLAPPDVWHMRLGWLRGWLVFGAVVALHAWLAVYSFSALLAMSHARAGTHPQPERFLWQVGVVVTWQPLLYPLSFSRVGRRMLNSHFQELAVVNSLVAVGLAVVIWRAIRRRRAAKTA